VGDSLSIGVIGAGPAGIMAALEGARLGARVTLYDTNERVGRKLLVTGNGRCNISNDHARAEVYARGERAFIADCLQRFGPQETVARLRELAIPTYATADGWRYPLSNSAAGVVEALSAAVALSGVAFRKKCKISDMQSAGSGLLLIEGGGEHSRRFDRVIVACGGVAYPALGSKGQLLPTLDRLGHSIVPPRPALVGIRAEMGSLHKLQGVRLDVGLTLRRDETVLGRTFGNLMFAKTGFSGPAAMDLSHLVEGDPPRDLWLEIDLLAESEDEIQRLIRYQRQSALPLTVVLGAALPTKIPPLLLEMASLAPDATLAQASDEQLDRLMHWARHLSARVTGTRGLAQAQVSTGGVPLGEVDPADMQSRRVPGLYLAGEVLDVIGPCGGYNLQWAWTSGALAGRGAAG